MISLPSTCQNFSLSNCRPFAGRPFSFSGEIVRKIDQTLKGQASLIKKTVCLAANILLLTAAFFVDVLIESARGLARLFGIKHLDPKKERLPSTPFLNVKADGDYRFQIVLERPHEGRITSVKVLPSAPTLPEPSAAAYYLYSSIEKALGCCPATRERWIESIRENFDEEVNIYQTVLEWTLIFYLSEPHTSELPPLLKEMNLSSAQLQNLKNIYQEFQAVKMTERQELLDTIALQNFSENRAIPHHPLLLKIRGLASELHDNRPFLQAYQEVSAFFATCSLEKGEIPLKA